MAAKRYQRGLVVGKFSPLHKGHEYLIQCALSQCIEVVIISYSRPEFSSCSAAIRDGWLKQRFPKANVLSVDAAMIETWRINSGWHLEMPQNESADHLHRAFTYSLISERLGQNVDAVFTSEEYGDGFADYLSQPNTGFGTPVEHVCVDQNRQTIPVSGTALRSIKSMTNNIPLALLADDIARDFQVQKVCLLGGESTGKTTLSKRLAEHFNEPFIDEYGRALWLEKNGDLSPSDLVDICAVQTHKEDQAHLNANQFIFSDTSPLTTLCYSEALFGQRPSIIQAYAERPYHYLFLCEPDFPFVQDGTRKGDAFRVWQHQWYLKELLQRGLPFVRLSGTEQDRFKEVCSTIQE